MARPLLLRLVKIGDGDGANDTRRRVPRTALVDNSTDPAAAAAVIDALTTARLLTRHRDTVEITHEALLRGWPRLRTWIDTDRTTGCCASELEEDAARWERAGRDPSSCTGVIPLESARSWAASAATFLPGRGRLPGGFDAAAAAGRADARRRQRRLTVLALAVCTPRARRTAARARRAPATTWRSSSRCRRSRPARVRRRLPLRPARPGRPSHAAR